MATITHIKEPEPQCVSCEFFFPLRGYDRYGITRGRHIVVIEKSPVDLDKSFPHGQCRRHPPTRTTLGQDDVGFTWPIVEDISWCGEWKHARHEVIVQRTLEKDPR